jgi:hypothetical protein
MEQKNIKDLKLKFIFFDYSKKVNWDPYYVNLIENTGDFKKGITYYYILGKDNQKINIKDETIENGNILDNNSPIFTIFNLRKLINTEQYQKKIKEGFTSDSRNLPLFNQQDPLFRDFIKVNYKIYKGVKERILWSVNTKLSQKNNYIAFVLHNSDIIGYSIADREEGDILAYGDYGDLLYIDSVNIRYDYQNKSICTPLVSFLIKKLHKLGYTKLFIDNASRTNGGVPACFCYTKAGIQNNYNIYYQTESNYNKTKTKSDVRIHKIPKDFCLKKKDSTRYYYLSKKIAKKGKQKIKKIVNTIKFLSKIKKSIKNICLNESECNQTKGCKYTTDQKRKYCRKSTNKKK